jgi:hypothetical protein
MSSFPSAEDARRLHDRLLDDDRAAHGDVCSAFLAPLLGFLHRRHDDRDPHLVESAVHQTLWDYVKNPRRYDPDRNPNLGAYLRMAADRDLLNLLEQEARHHRRRESVELDSLAGNSQGEEGPTIRLYREEERAERERIFDSVAGQCDGTDREVLRLMREGVTALAPFASVLGVAHLPIEQQRKAVKQAKDRVKQRLRRFKRHA